jgi:hypothetical protein
LGGSVAVEENYRRRCAEHEPHLSPGCLGRAVVEQLIRSDVLRWGSPDLEGQGAPRWKQGAIYDALKDTLPLLGGGARFARVATHDTVNGVSLGAMLDGLALVDPAGVRIPRVRPDCLSPTDE